MTRRGTGGEPCPASRAPCPVSILIVARDEEEQLPLALASVTDWADEVLVVVDPRTRDRTREIARDSGAVVVEHPFQNSSEQLSWGLERCRHDRVLVLDADERLTPELRLAIVQALAVNLHPAYAVKRRNLAFGRALSFGDWGGDRVIRLLDRRHVELTGGMHWRVTAASTGQLAGTLLHDTLRSLDQYLPKLADYCRRGAADAIAAGATSGPLTIVLRSVWRFVRSYVVRLGVLDGVPGLVVAGLAAYGTFCKWTLVWQGTTERARRP